MTTMMAPPRTPYDTPWWEMSDNEWEQHTVAVTTMFVEALEEKGLLPGTPPPTPAVPQLESDDPNQLVNPPDPEPSGFDEPAEPEPEYDPKMPWRVVCAAPLPENPSADPDPQDMVVPGTVIDRGPAGRTGLGSGTKLDWRTALTWLLNKWETASQTVRTGVILFVILSITGLLVAMCGGHQKAEPSRAVGGAAPPVAESAEPQQETTLMPVKVTDFCPARSTHATLAFSGVNKNAWVCVRAHGIDGARFEVYFDAPVVVTSITVVPGWDYVEPNGLNHWNEHRLVTRILWRLGGKQLVQNINPTPAGSTLKVPQIATVSMSGTIQATKAPPDAGGGGPFGGLGMDKKLDQTFAIGKIVITGYVAGK
jgi:hypothetical protein